MNGSFDFDNGGSGGMPSTQNLARRGLSAVGFLAAGVGLFVMGSLPPLLGIIAGAAACFFGVGSVFSHDSADRVGGTVLFAGGALTLLAKFRIPLLALPSQVLMSVGAAACLGLGIWNGIKFLRGLQERR
jgi:hypothetical protein